MEEREEGFYSEERWNNWMERIREEEFDPEDEDSALLFFNLQDDITIACTKAVSAYDDGEIDDENFIEEIQEIRDVVMREEDLGNEEKTMTVEGVQTSLICVLASCETYVANGTTEEGEVSEYIREALRAEEQEDMNRALALVAEAGARILGGEDFEPTDFDDLEYGFVAEWVNGLESLASAVSEPETIEGEKDSE